MTPSLAEHLTRVHAEMALVLQIGVSTGAFRAGRYALTREYDYTSWEAVEGAGGNPPQSREQ